LSATYEYRQGEAELISTIFPEFREDCLAQKVIAGALRTRLTPKQRQALLLHYAAGMTVSQIARERGVYPSTVWRTLRRARDELMWASRLGGIDIDD